ncbi:hypothetical protein [Ilumatobacter nonamiensis]|uniref:hypothetical protein n=1 Tax=Ilumatobacter nonamiensis TaxID=467093 RepID=UPI00034C0BD4|nr:hypothetical protein [Ilumatobacter nonamiensis]
MTPLERLRLAAALCHAVPGAQLRLHTDRDETVVVGHHVGADIDPCAMRRVVAASACPHQPDLSAHLSGMEVGGALIDLGGGVAGSQHAGREQRWIASLLPADRIISILDDSGSGLIPDDAMKATVKPDPGLGVTVLMITSIDPRFDHALDAVVEQVAASCFVEELRTSMSNLDREDDHSGSTS